MAPRNFQISSIMVRNHYKGEVGKNVKKSQLLTYLSVLKKSYQSRTIWPVKISFFHHYQGLSMRIFGNFWQIMSLIVYKHKLVERQWYRCLHPMENLIVGRANLTYSRTLEVENFQKFSKFSKIRLRRRFRCLKVSRTSFPLHRKLFFCHSV